MNTRREFLRTVLYAVPFVFLGCNSKKSSSDQTGDAVNAKNLISEDHPSAQTLKYVHDGMSVNSTKGDRGGVPPQQQSCNNCQLFKPIGADYGACQVLPQGNVSSRGWCISWVQKQPAT